VTPVPLAIPAPAAAAAALLPVARGGLHVPQRARALSNLRHLIRVPQQRLARGLLLAGDADERVLVEERLDTARGEHGGGGERGGQLLLEANALERVLLPQQMRLVLSSAAASHGSCGNVFLLGALGLVHPAHALVGLRAEAALRLSLTKLL
jgi:hypothetical protein